MSTDLYLKEATLEKNEDGRAVHYCAKVENVEKKGQRTHEIHFSLKTVLTDTGKKLGVEAEMTVHRPPSRWSRSMPEDGPDQITDARQIAWAELESMVDLYE